jgi:putative membrane protein
MKKLSIYFLANILALYISSYFQILKFDNIQSLLIAGVVLAFINILIRPLVMLISLPVTLLTLGLFTLIIDTLMIMLTDTLVSGIQIHGFLMTLVLAIIIYVSTAVVKPIVDNKH